MAYRPRIDKYLREQKAQDGLYWCSKCKQFLPAHQFYRNTHRANGLSCYCKPCHQAAQNTKDEDKPKRKRKDGTYWATETHRTRKKKAIKMTGGCCQKCGYNDYSSSLCFHHVDPGDKELAHLAFSKRLETILAEIDKCILLCHNCHFAYHASEWTAKFIKRDGLGWTIQAT